ncbi:diacylglycerol kinase family lipid kinase [Auraticoccus sp. F435]|uniref:Diacylglycerol kinase family lipid kinase n=1 Tax=Auraticoccus cholistanensis TaxID=2656650 RepID=A0A6A9UVM3_9ACTN|nr:diacylglycerol kinase family protein [Auraticoccus cholistanensis]MVA75614.1 diacylglycerol kinase family lipid kinase [Auraticoccus cholistanensis]
MVVNPTAGKGRAGRRLPDVLTAVARALPRHRIDVRRTEGYPEAREACGRAVEDAEAAAGRDDCLLVMGGDGMMHLGVNACAGTSVPLGMLPAGTGNDMCRGLGLDLRGPVRAAERLGGARTRTVDALRVEGELAEGRTSTWVGSVVATGFDARVNRRANAMARPKGNLRYAVAALAELATFTPLPYRLAVDGTSRELEAMLVAVGNGGYYGGGMNICPSADPTDGQLDVTIIHPASRATLLALLPLMFTGWFVHHPAVERLRARRVDLLGDGLVAMGDGELLGPAPLSVRSVPAALTVLA